MRYFFDLQDGRMTVKDPQGSDLHDDDAAREAAIVVLPDIVRYLMDDAINSEMTSIVRDETGRVVFHVKLTQTKS